MGPDRLRRAGNFQRGSKANRAFFGYSARGPLREPEGRDDGTIAPTAAWGRYPLRRRSCCRAPKRCSNNLGLRSLWVQGQLQSELHLYRPENLRPAPSTRSTAGWRPTISGSTRVRSCFRRRTIVTISCGGTCGAYQRSAAGCCAPDLRAGGSVDRNNAAKPGHSALVEGLNRDPVAHTDVERAQLLLKRCAVAELICPKLVGQREPVRTYAEANIVAHGARNLPQRIEASRWSE